MVQLMGSFGEGVHTQHELVEAFHKFVTTTEHVINEKPARPTLSGNMSTTPAKVVKRAAPQEKPRRRARSANHKMPVRNGKIVAF